MVTRLLRGEPTEDTRMAIASSPLNKDVPLLAAHSDEADNRLIARIRLVLAASALLVAIVDHTGPGQANAAPLAVLASYTAICTAAYVSVYFQLRWAKGKLMHRLDAGVFVAMAAANGVADIFPLMFLFFAVVVASLRYGLDEGGRVTLIAVVLYCVLALAKLHHVPPARLFLHAAVLLAIGRAIAQLGERHIQAARRQALLRDLNQVANPRFGIDRTMTAALERTRAFFMADSCIAPLEVDTGRYALRAVRADGPLVAPAAAVYAELAHAMLPEPRTHVLLYARAWRRWQRLAATSLSHAGGPGRWVPQDQAGLLEARSFISAPWHSGRARAGFTSPPALACWDAPTRCSWRGSPPTNCSLSTGSTRSTGSPRIRRRWSARRSPSTCTTRRSSRISACSLGWLPCAARPRRKIRSPTSSTSWWRWRPMSSCSCATTPRVHPAKRPPTNRSAWPRCGVMPPRR